MVWCVLAFLDNALLEAFDPFMKPEFIRPATTEEQQTRHYALNVALRCCPWLRNVRFRSRWTLKRIEKAQGQGRKNGLLSYSISIANKTTTNVESQVGLLYLTPLLSFADQACEDLHTPGLRARRSC